MKNKVIFLAENDTIIAMDLKTILKRNGFNNISFFTDGVKLLEHSLSQPPDLIIADILLSKKTDGFNYIKKLWEVFNVPVLFISALDFSKYKDQVASQNCFFLSKPFKELDIIQCVSSLLNPQT